MGSAYAGFIQPWMERGGDAWPAWLGCIDRFCAALGADVVLGSCVRWLCGGRVAGFWWLGPGLMRQLKPVDVGWFSHADPFEMDIHSFRYADDARRFWGGTPSVAPYAIATAGLELLGAVGIEAVLAHNRALIDAFLQAAPHRVPVGVRL